MMTEITINGRDYAISCDEAGEEHIQRLGEYMDRKVQGLVDHVGQIGDAKLLVMASLLVVDELFDTRIELQEFKPDDTVTPLRKSDAENDN